MNIEGKEYKMITLRGNINDSLEMFRRL